MNQKGDEVMNQLRLTSLTFLGFYVTSAIDAGLADRVSFEEIYAGLKSRSLFQDLDRRLPNTFDFSLFPKGSDSEAAMLHALTQAAEGLEGRERRKTGVENSGLCLLLAFIFEAIQHREWV
jgi:hypothetical protein